MSDGISDWLPVVVEGALFLFAAGGAWQIVKSNRESNAALGKNAKELGEKLDSVVVKITEKLDIDIKAHSVHDEQEFKARDSKHGELVSKLNTIEVQNSSAREQHMSLSGKHDTLAGELRNRVSALEGRVSTVEQSSAESRVEMRGLQASAVRIEAKQDAQTLAIESLRRDVLSAPAPARRKRA